MKNYDRKSKVPLKDFLVDDIWSHGKKHSNGGEKPCEPLTILVSFVELTPSHHGAR